MENGSKPKTFKEVAKCFFTKSAKALAAMPDGQACLSVNYFHVVGSPFLQLAVGDVIKVGVIDYLSKHGMMVSLGSMCAKPGRKMTVHSLVAYTKERVSSLQKDSKFVSNLEGARILSTIKL